MRLFEATGLACALITDKKKDLSDYFDEDKEVLSYKSKDELIEKIKYLVSDSNKAKELGINAQNKVLKKYTTKIQIKHLSDIIKRNFGN